MQSDFVLGWERATDSYGIHLSMVKRSSAGPCKIIHPDVYHWTITN